MSEAGQSIAEKTELKFLEFMAADLRETSFFNPIEFKNTFPEEYALRRKYFFAGFYKGLNDTNSLQTVL